MLWQLLRAHRAPTLGHLRLRGLQQCHQPRRQVQLLDVGSRVGAAPRASGRSRGFPGGEDAVPPSDALPGLSEALGGGLGMELLKCCPRPSGKLPDAPTLVPFSDPHFQPCQLERGHLGSRLHLCPALPSLLFLLFSLPSGCIPIFLRQSLGLPWASSTEGSGRGRRTDLSLCCWTISELLGTLCRV